MGSVWESVAIEKKWELCFSNAETWLQIGIVKDLIYMHARVHIIRLDHDLLLWYIEWDGLSDQYISSSCGLVTAIHDSLF